ncbi:MAG: anthranilate phosphoribosyltransferase [Chloroflexi bacterium]|nr:anthranilate phosphoribosyltransferase [Chloroflexota bacterium]
MIREAIALVVEGHELTIPQAEQVMDEILQGAVTPAQFGALMLAMRMRGETSLELAGFATAMRRHALHVPVDVAVVDTCGTGGDDAGTFNISTIAALVVAAAGQPVAKHGNRAMSSSCGSADVLEGLGANVQMSAEQVSACIAATNFGFMFAPLFHPSMRFAAPLRREIGVRTAFNLLGPLTNPARTRHQLVGTPNPVIGEKMARALAHLETAHALVVCGEHHVDELLPAGQSDVWEVRGTEVRHFILTPESVGITQSEMGTLRGGDVTMNVTIARSVIEGGVGPQADAVALNAGAALYAADRVASIEEGVALAADTLHSQRVRETLERVIEFGAQK